MSYQEKSELSWLVNLEQVRTGNLLTPYDLAPEIWTKPKTHPSTIVRLGYSGQSLLAGIWEGPEATLFREHNNHCYISFVYRSDIPPLLIRQNGKNPPFQFLNLPASFNYNNLVSSNPKSPDSSDLVLRQNLEPKQKQIGNFPTLAGLESIQPEDVLPLKYRFYLSSIQGEVFRLFHKHNHAEGPTDPSRIILSFNLLSAAIYFDDKVDEAKKRLFEEIANSQNRMTDLNRKGLDDSSLSNRLRADIEKYEEELEKLMEQPDTPENLRYKALADAFFAIPAGFGD